VLWERSLSRSHRRRERARRARRNAPRQKGVTLAAGAAILATPVAAPLAASAASSHPGVSKAEIDTRAAAPHEAPVNLLSYGDTGQAVAAIQAQLRIVTDGIYGPQTEGAVKQFQIAHGLGATGIVDTHTWAELFRVQVKYFGSSSSSSSAHTVLASAGTQPAASPSTGGPDLSDRADVRGEIESSSPSNGSEPAPAPAPAPAQPTPVSTSGSGGCTSDGRIVTPVSNGTETSPYGDDRGDHIHSGEDIAAPTGTTVRAANCGTVSISGTESGYGEMVCIQHAGSTTTCYAHLSERDVAVNDYVKAGQKIGEVGCTGNCTGPHVHFEVRLDGKATDPAPYLSGAKTVQGQSVPATTAALPAGQGGTGGPSAADEAAVWGEATGGTTAPAAAQPAALQPAQTTPQPGVETAPAETAPQPAETAPAATAPQPAAETAAQAGVETAPAETAPQPAETAPAAPVAPAPQPAETAPAAPAETAPQPAATAPAETAPAAPAEAAPPTAPAETAPAAPAPAPAQPAAPAPAAPAAQAPAPTAEPSAPATQAAPAPAADATASAPAPEAPAQTAAADAGAAATGGATAP
jgi:Meckel syndrome type 1 protein